MKFRIIATASASKPTDSTFFSSYSDSAFKFLKSAAAIIAGELMAGYPVEKLGSLVVNGKPIPKISNLWVGAESGLIYRFGSRQFSMFGIDYMPALHGNKTMDTVAKTTVLSVGFLVFGGQTVDNLRMGRQLNKPLASSYGMVINAYMANPANAYMRYNRGLVMSSTRNVTTYIAANLGTRASQLGWLPKTNNDTQRRMLEGGVSFGVGGVGGFVSAPIQAARVKSYQGFIKTTQWPSIVTAVAETLKTGQWLKFAPFRTMSQAGYALIYWAITTNLGAKKG